MGEIAQRGSSVQKAVFEGMETVTYAPSNVNFGYGARTS